MNKFTQKQLIEQLGQLKKIKPRKAWVLLLKSQITESKERKIIVPAKTVGIMDTLSAIFAPKKLAYSFAIVLFLVIGVFGFAQYTVPGDLLFPIKKIAEHSQAALTGQTGVKQNVASLASRINELALVAKEGRKDNIPSAISEVNANVAQVAKDLKDNPVQDLDTLKDIAKSLKTLADVPGTDLTSNPEVKDLYEAVVRGQIEDLEKTTLTEEQSIVLAEVKGLYDEGKYVDALEKILLIDK